MTASTCVSAIPYFWQSDSLGSIAPIHDYKMKKQMLGNVHLQVNAPTVHVGKKCGKFLSSDVLNRI